MQTTDSSIWNWFYNTPYRALDRAYKASKQVCYVQTLYAGSTIKPTLKCSWYNIYLYTNAILDEASFEIYWGLLEFRVSALVFGLLTHLSPQNSDSLAQHHSLVLRLRQIFSKHFCRHTDFRLETLNVVKRKLLWIEAALLDLNKLKHQWRSTPLSIPINTSKFYSFPSDASSMGRKGITYESVGLVPRSITKTLSRFQKELAGQSASLVIPEFQLAKYQAATSLQYMAFLVIFPWSLSFFCKITVLQSFVENLWNSMQPQVFLNTLQEQTALKRLQEIEELLWFDIVSANTSKDYLQDFATEIHTKTIHLVNEYNVNSIQTLLHLFTNSISLISVTCILIWGKKRFAILNSWLQELFYSLSDTMKAFFILLFTDLCIGFHSPHGWEILISSVLEQLGFSHNKHVISCFVSTFPVILDTVFKYWIFRHLNRISPSIVVTYHAMNE